MTNNFLIEKFSLKLIFMPNLAQYLGNWDKNDIFSEN